MNHNSIHNNEQSQPNPYLTIYQSYNFKSDSNSTKNDAQSIARHLGMIHNTFGYVVKDFVNLTKYKFVDHENTTVKEKPKKTNENMTQKANSFRFKPNEHFGIGSVDLEPASNQASQANQTNSQQKQSKFNKIMKTLEDHEKRTKNYDKFQIHPNCQPIKNNEKSSFTQIYEKSSQQHQNGIRPKHNHIIELDDE